MQYYSFVNTFVAHHVEKSHAVALSTVETSGWRDEVGVEIGERDKYRCPSGGLRTAVRGARRRPVNDPSDRIQTVISKRPRGRPYSRVLPPGAAPHPKFRRFAGRRIAKEVLSVRRDGALSLRVVLRPPGGCVAHIDGGAGVAAETNHACRRDRGDSTGDLWDLVPAAIVPVAIFARASMIILG